MWDILGIISFMTALAAFVGIIVGLIIGIARKRWRVLKYSSAICGVALVLFIVAVSLDGSSDESEGTSAAARASNSREESEPTSTPIPTFEDLKEAAKRVPWEELYRNNETYEGDLVYLKGEVVQVVADDNSDKYRIRVAVTETDGRYDSDEVVFVHYRGSERLLEEDIIEIVCNVEGLYTYRSVLGGPITIPEINETRIERVSGASGSEQALIPQPGDSRENPIPFGEPGITDEGLALWVLDVIEDAAQMVLEENQFNDPPPDGHQFVMVKIRVKNDTPEAKRYSSNGLKIVGQSNVEYDGLGCGVIPDAFDSSRNMFKGGELSGNVCFNVESSDVSSLVMYDSYAYDPSDWLFFALR